MITGDVPLDPTRSNRRAMSEPRPNGRMARVIEAHRLLTDFAIRSRYAERKGDPEIFDFTFGNPQEMPIPGFAESLQKWAVPRNKDWYAYKLSEPEARECVAESLRAWRGLAFEAEDIALTNGAFGAIAAAIQVFTEPGDEVVFSLPPWFGYEPMLVLAGAVPVKVKVRPESFDLDLAAIEAAITPRTGMVIVNTPNNPTGRIYSPESLAALGDLMGRTSERNGRPITLLSDEPYSRLVFDGRRFHSPAEYYAHTLIAYSYGKVLLTPGQRIGFLALSPKMPGREARRFEVMNAQVAGGWLFPNALLQHAIGDLEKLSIDLSELQRKRDLMVAGLRAQGYQVHEPDGTFYLLPKAPLDDDMAFAGLLAERDIFVMPGTICSIPGYFRITLTASAERLAQSLEGFGAARRQATQQAS